MSVEATAYLISRASAHGITLDDLLAMTPSCIVDDMQKCVVFWEQRDISHILSQSLHPHLASDPSNMIPEHESPNSSRGSDPMTNEDQTTADLDNEVLAQLIDMGMGDVYVYADLPPIDVILA